MTRVRVLLAAAVIVIAAGGELIAVTWHTGYWHGLYCSLGTAATVGCDIAPPGTSGRLTAAVIILVAIPLLAACFGQLHLDKIRAHLDKHHEAVRGRLDRIEDNAAQSLRHAARVTEDISDIKHSQEVTQTTLDTKAGGRR